MSTTQTKKENHPRESAASDQSAVYLQPRPQRLLIISNDVVGERMAGPGIRYLHLARVLAQHLPTTLAAPNPPTWGWAPPDFALVSYRAGDWGSLAAHVAAATICFAPGDLIHQLPQLAQSDLYLVIDGYDPLLAEWLALPPVDNLDQQHEAWHNRMVALSQQYRAGDFYLCASERQRDWWLGLLEANGRINPFTFNADSSLRKLIDVVPFGLPSTLIKGTRPVMRGVWPGIGREDKVLLWGGGLWPWLDPGTAIRAVAQLWQRRQDIRLIFPGTRHPNPAVATMPTAAQAAQEVAASLGLLDRAVFFGDWIPYADWPNVLLESDLALTLHFDTLETRLAFRSRVFDYIWAGLPIVASGGDATSELIQGYGVGIVVGDQDVAGVAMAIDGLLAEPSPVQPQHFERARQELTWERAAVPLINYCRNPWRAADRRILTPAQSVSTAADEAERLRHERDQWRALAQAYERGRFMRLMKWLKTVVGHV